MVSTKSESLNSPNDILPLRAAPSGNLEKLAGLAKVARCCLIYVSGQGRFHDELTAEVAEVTRGKKSSIRRAMVNSNDGTHVLHAGVIH